MLLCMKSTVCQKAHSFSHQPVINISKGIHTTMVNGTKKIYGAVITVGAIFGFSIGLLSGSISRSNKLDAEQKSLEQVQSSMMESLNGNAVTSRPSKAAKTKSAKAEM